MKAVVYNLGCKVNAYESFSIMNGLKDKGYEVFNKLILADLYIINTCAVTNEAERKSRQVISKIEKLNPNAEIIVCGCASEKNPESFKNKNDNVKIAGTFGKGRLADNLDKEIFVKEKTNEYEDDLYPLNLRTRGFIKVQDGCDNFCSYCIVPYLRGRSRSRKIESILTEIKNSSAKEIVLTAVNLSDYGKNINLTLIDLINALNGVEQRIRLGSLEVNIISKEFLSALKSNKNFCPHFHLSLQSGSDNVLKLMNRKYAASDYLSAVRLIREFFPDAGITTDVIIGFPGETDEDFLKTAEVCRKAEFSDIHIFPYSKREGTKAYNLRAVDKETVNSRVEILTGLKYELIQKFIAKNLNKCYNILIEEKKEGYFTGYTENYIKCYGSGLAVDKIFNLKLTEAFKDGVLLGE